MTFEELKFRIQNKDNVVLKCSSKFVIKQMNLFDGLQNNNDIILIAKLFYSDHYNENDQTVHGDMIGGGIWFYPKLNTTISSTDCDYICNKRGNGEYAQMTMMVFNDEDCSGIEVLNVCGLSDCGL